MSADQKLRDDLADIRRREREAGVSLDPVPPEVHAAAARLQVRALDGLVQRAVGLLEGVAIARTADPERLLEAADALEARRQAIVGEAPARIVTSGEPFDSERHGFAPVNP